LPEHCISYAYIMEWPQVFPDKKLDKDSPEDMQWVYERALARAEKYNIKGVTYMLTMGVVKNIIPAVASTNAVISAACVNEAFKLLTYASQSLNTYYMYMGSTGIYTHTFEYGRRADCLVCSGDKMKMMEIQRDYTLMNLIDALMEDPELQLRQPSITSATKTLYMQKPPALEQSTRSNLAKTLSELVEPDEVLSVTDPLFPPGVVLSVSLKFV
jgi:ubiquitin-activating enzyme E1 C